MSQQDVSVTVVRPPDEPVGVQVVPPPDEPVDVAVNTTEEPVVVEVQKTEEPVSVEVHTTEEPVNVEVVEKDLAGKWQRPADWLDCDFPTKASDEKFVGLVAIYPDDASRPNVLSFNASLTTGGYAIDWGDGAVESYSGGETATHEYDYDSIAAETLTSEGFRQVVVTVTPDTGKFTTIYLHYGVPDQKSPYYGWLDIAIGSETMTRARFSGSYSEANSCDLKRVRMYVESLNSCSYMFYGCIGLESVNQFDSSNVTTFYYAYYFCASLRSAPHLDTSNGTNFTGMHAYNSSLLELPPYDLRKATSLTSFLVSSQSIVKLNPGIKWPEGVSYYQFSNSNTSLREFPDVAYAPSDIYMAYCYNMRLPKGAVFTVPDGTNLDYAFRQTGITEFPTVLGRPGRIAYIAYYTTKARGSFELDCSLVTYAYRAFDQCRSLEGLKLNGLRYGTSIYNCSLGFAALEEFLYSLGTAAGAQTVDMRGNPGIPELVADGTAIADANARGWTLLLQ